MADVKLAYQAAQTLTNAIASLGSSSTWLAGYESDTIDNTSNLYLDYLFDGKVTVGTTPTVNTEIRIYAVAVGVDGSTYPDVFDGTTGAETVNSAGVLDSFAKLAAALTVDSTTSNREYPFSFTIAALWGGVVPKKFFLFTAHNTGVNLNATGGNHVFKYSGVYETVT